MKNNIVRSITELVGVTPILEIRNYKSYLKLTSSIFAKLESFNPCSSIKDRVALSMIETALKDGSINNETTIIEPTSGNTGIGLAMVAASLGLKLVLTMPESMSIERRKILTMLGAELVLTDKTKGMKGAIERAEELRDNTPNSIVLDQFSNPANTAAHANTAAEIIYQQPDIDYLVAGVGTGGTISGIGAALKAYNPNIKIVAVEPFESAVISGENPGAHKLQGIGAGFIPANLNTDIIDTIIKVKSEDAFTHSRLIAKTEGVLVGISSGAALYAASQISKETTGANIVVILPDSAERYISTELFDF